MKLFEHPDCGVWIAESRTQAMEAMGDELPACERDPDAIRELAGSEILRVEDEEGNSDTKTVSEWTAEAVAVGCDGLLFGSYTIVGHSPKLGGNR